MRKGVPNIANRTSGAAPRGQIMFALVGAFAISYFAKMSQITVRIIKDGKTTTSFDKEQFAKATQITARSIFAWFVVLIAISAMSDFDSTQQLALAFAWLVFITALLLNGPAAINVWQKEINRGKAK